MNTEAIRKKEVIRVQCTPPKRYASKVIKQANAVEGLNPKMENP